MDPVIFEVVESAMKLVCKQLRYSDAWFQIGFVSLFFCLINVPFFVWPDENFERNLLLVLLIDAFLLLFVFSNIQVWKDGSQNLVLVRRTFLGFIVWRSTTILQSNLTHVCAVRASDNESWPNCYVELHWIETGDAGVIESRSTIIMQRRQDLPDTIKESKLVAARLGVKFVDSTKKS